MKREARKNEERERERDVRRGKGKLREEWRDAISGKE